MAEKQISYLNRNYDDYKRSIKEIAKQYYPDVFSNLNDSNIGSWLIDVIADIGDNLNFHIDRSVQELSLDSTNQLQSLMDIARTNGLKIPYKKAALVEVELTCELPIYEQGSGGNGKLEGDERYAPIVNRGTKFSNGLTTFELIEDVNFGEQFNENGVSNRQIKPIRNSNGLIIAYSYSKLAIARASQSKIMKKIITPEEIRPFMEIMISDENVISVDSIIVKEGTSVLTDPHISEFFVDNETFVDKSNRNVKRFFEVDNLIQQERFGYKTDELNTDVVDEKGKRHRHFYNPVWEMSEYADITDDDGDTIEIVPLRVSAKGEWKRLKNKFITEYTNDWKMKIIFGAGLENKYGEIPKDAKLYTQYQMSRMLANDYMGVLPKANSTMYILYQTGGGEITNIAKDTLTNIISLNIEIAGNCEDSYNSLKIGRVKDSLTVTNTTPSYGGKDEPSIEELRYLIKYNAATQNRCVTLKDYNARIAELPAKYGIPFRYNCVEENNKIIIYTLGINEEGLLTNFLSETVAENIKNYLSHYRMMNDYIEIKSGRVVNLGFKLSVYLDKTYDKSEVVKRIIDLVYDYMDVRKHLMGEDIYLGDLQKEISKLDGVVNLSSLRITNKVGGSYSMDAITQKLRTKEGCNTQDEEILENEIDLKSSDYVLYSEANSMFEIHNKTRDILVEVKVRN